MRAEPGINARAAYDRAVNRLIDVIDALDRPVDHAPEPADIALNGEVVSNTTPAEYKAMVGRAKDYIAAGDIFQVVLSQRFEAPVSSSSVFPLPRASPREPLAVSSISSTSTVFRSSVRARRSWFACAMAT